MAFVYNSAESRGPIFSMMTMTTAEQCLEGYIYKAASATTLTIVTGGADSPTCIGYEDSETADGVALKASYCKVIRRGYAKVMSIAGTYVFGEPVYVGDDGDTDGQACQDAGDTDNSIVGFFIQNADGNTLGTAVSAGEMVIAELLFIRDNGPFEAASFA